MPGPTAFEVAGWGPAAGAAADSAGVAPACAGTLVVPGKAAALGVLSASMSGMLRVLRLCSVFEPRELTRPGWPTIRSGGCRTTPLS